MLITERIDRLQYEGRLLGAAAARAGTAAPVPTCPGWTVRDLVRHTTTVHRWATAFVVEGHRTFVPAAAEPDLDGEELLAHFHEGHTALVAALRDAPDGLECWTFMPAPSPRDFWARRQLHETMVHRVDAESACDGPVSPVEAAHAVDGIDELLRAFHAREKSRVRTPSRRVLRVRATDTDAAWTVRLSPAAPVASRDDGYEQPSPADCELTGTAAALCLTLWNRLPLTAVRVTGDPALARLWRENSAVTW
ncbi:maleylpyruvate isomerase family mycothiol-dependent enzyme [uncultured Streptomyces sp.]|uniref:maleylpyruvate isomerase family mycothiol-dependent enzyme n=1 Tax=uncultured Streptomyces sp. TaxID=174707 RepID=UPI00261A2558|nr:maleylpyruvate isomerase family mycothiol-dependent enzyme [uncultured Streptomyces sp.]